MIYMMFSHTYILQNAQVKLINLSITSTHTSFFHLFSFDKSGNPCIYPLFCFKDQGERGRCGDTQL